MVTFTIQCGLGIALFFIINWIGRNSTTFGYLSLSVFVKADEAPAFNLIVRIISPIVYLLISAATLYYLGLDNYVDNFYMVSFYYITTRLLVNLLTDRYLLINWPKQILYWIIIMSLSYFIYIKIIITRNNLLPDFSNLANELWIIICVFLYQLFNNTTTANESTIDRKERYLKRKFVLFRKMYSEDIEVLKNSRLISLAYAILIYENFNRPYLYRIMALLHGYVDWFRMVLGIPSCVKRFRQLALT